jgi:hypothetical protein
LILGKLYTVVLLGQRFDRPACCTHASSSVERDGIIVSIISRIMSCAWLLLASMHSSQQQRHHCQHHQPHHVMADGINSIIFAVMVNNEAWHKPHSRAFQPIQIPTGQPTIRLIESTAVPYSAFPLRASVCAALAPVVSHPALYLPC